MSSMIVNIVFQHSKTSCQNGFNILINVDKYRGPNLVSLFRHMDVSASKRFTHGALLDVNSFCLYQCNFHRFHEQINIYHF